MATKKNEIAKRPTNAIAQVDFGDDAGAGFEDATRDDFAIPYLSLLQSNSPQVEDGDMKGGNLFNTVTEEEIETATIVPVAREHVFIEFVPRDQGGGFKGRHEPTSEIVRNAKAASTKFGKYTTPEGNDLVETIMVYAVDADTLAPIVIPIKGTSIKGYKKWWSRLRAHMAQQPDGSKRSVPLYANLTRVGSEKTKNEKGSFYLYEFSAANGSLAESIVDPGSDLYTVAREFRAQVVAGNVRTADESMSSAEADDGNGAF